MKSISNADFISYHYRPSEEAAPSAPEGCAGAEKHGGADHMGKAQRWC